MKRILFLSLILVFGFLLTCGAWYYNKLNPGKPHKKAIVSKNLLPRLQQHATPLLAYAKKNGYNTNTCFLIDMNLESGSNRFFIYDLQHNAVRDAGLVAHGRCNKDWLNGRQYGNAVGCGCTSLGKYKIGKPYYGKFGLAYKLHGLDSTNDNAFKRYVVLHSHSCIPASEVGPAPICQSDGCPTVSASFLQKLAPIIDGSNKPVLLFTFD